jgi:gliding motility-associated-like protein
MNQLSKLIGILILLALNAIGTAQTASFTANKVTGCDSLEVTFTNTSTGLSGTDFNYLWDFGKDGVSQSFNPGIHRFHKHGIYNVTLTVSSISTDKKYSATKVISVRPHPNANFTVADTLNLKTDQTLPYVFRTGRIPVDTIVYKYTWMLSATDSVVHNAPTEINRDMLIRNFSEGSSYRMILRVSDNFGCIDTFSKSFFVSEMLNIPNVFTPDGNGNLDFFKVETNGRTVYSLKIYTSAGQLIFKSLSKSILWDGTNSDGSQAIPGTYYYIIQAESEPIKKENCGYLMLLKRK